MSDENIDDPFKPEFASWRSYWHYAQRVRFRRRYVWDKHTLAFIDTVKATLRDRDVEFSKGKTLWRAQLGIELYKRDENHAEEPSGYNAERMKPRANRAMEGRANAAGVSVLYMGTTQRTAISEVRPWIGAEVSIAQLQLNRDIKVLDLTRGHGKLSFAHLQLDQLTDGKATPEQREVAVWIDIDNAFSRPVTKSDDMADYVPTQILAEVFREMGYDAIAYKSQFGKDGYNIAAFNPEDADVIGCAPFEVSEIDIAFQQSGNAWSKVNGQFKEKLNDQRD